MSQYAARVVANVGDACLSRQGQPQAMEALSAWLTMYAQDGWTLHSIEQVPVLPAYSGKAMGTVILGIYEHE
jgi:hypothetical protein